MPLSASLADVIGETPLVLGALGEKVPASNGARWKVATGQNYARGPSGEQAAPPKLAGRRFVVVLPDAGERYVAAALFCALSG